MNISQLFRFARNDSIKDFFPLIQIKTSVDKAAYKDIDYMVGYTLDEFKNEFPTIDATKIFFCPGIHKTYYFDRENHVLFIVPLYGTKANIPSDKSLEGYVNSILDEFSCQIKKRAYGIPIMAVSDRMRMEYFNLLLEDNMVEGLFEYFIDAYTISDFGCEAISHENMTKLFASRPAEEKNKVAAKKAKALKMYPQSLTVYRGEASMSTPYHKSWSWTLDINIANFFATRLGEDGSRIILGTVKKEHIEIYLNNERECMINPCNIENIEVIDLYGHLWLKDKMQGYVMKMYCQYRDMLIKKYKKSHSTELHKLVHSARVLCLALLLGDLYKLNLSEMTNLATAIVYHDLGRVDDSADDLHGKRGAKIFMKTRASSGIDKKLVSFLIEYHCLDDGIAHEFIKTNFDNDERVLLLFNIVKDADALDRVRFGRGGDGLNISYLRLDESKKMTLIASLCLKGIRVE